MALRTRLLRGCLVSIITNRFSADNPNYRVTLLAVIQFSFYILHIVAVAFLSIRVFNFFYSSNTSVWSLCCKFHRWFLSRLFCQIQTTIWWSPIGLRLTPSTHGEMFLHITLPLLCEFYTWFNKMLLSFLFFQFNPCLRWTSHETKVVHALLGPKTIHVTDVWTYRDLAVSDYYMFAH